MRMLLNQPAASWPELRPVLRRVEVRARSLVLEIIAPAKRATFDHSAADCEAEPITDGAVRFNLMACMEPRKGKTTLAAPAARLGRGHFDRPLIAALKRAHRELSQHGIAPASGRADLKEARGLADPYLRRIAALAFLAPDIQRAILKGEQPPWLTLKQLTDSELPSNWGEQRDKFAFSPAHS
jgi:hypothetical protein